MAPPLDTEAQFKFLIACIKHSNAGKIDFDNVAKECDIVSKGAAAKRYERLMKAHGITGNNGTGGSGGKTSAGPSTPKTPKTPARSKGVAGSARASSSKKRKIASSSEDIDDDIVKNEVKREIKHEADVNNPGEDGMC